MVGAAPIVLWPASRRWFSEFAWAGLFSEYGTREELFAFAFATNAIFLLLNVAIGVVFLGRALQLLAEVRRRRAQGAPIPEPLLHDATDP